MIEVVIFGGLHDSLDHREKLQDALKSEIRGRAAHPRFVAVEWREEVYRALTAERQWLENRLRERWDNPADEVVRLAAASLCWEADAHVDVAGKDLPVIYLDGLLDRRADEWAIRDPRNFLIYAKSAPLVNVISSEDAKSIEKATAASNAVSWPGIEEKDASARGSRTARAGVG